MCKLLLDISSHTVFVDLAEEESKRKRLLLKEPSVAKVLQKF